MTVEKRKQFFNARRGCQSYTGNKKHQEGVVVLAVVAILLGIVTFATVTASQSVQQFYTSEKARRNAESNQVELKMHVKNVARALRSQNVLSALTTTDVAHLSTTVLVSELEGIDSQPLTQFEVSVSHDSTNATHTAKFLRYPSLLRLPTSAQQFSWDSQLTNWLFNRDASALSANFFAEGESLTQCHNMLSGSVFWITGDCVLDPSDLPHNSSSNPVLLIVADGDLTLQANTHLYGLIVMLSSSHNSYTLRVASSASINGSYVSNAPVTEQINGTATLSTPLLKALQENTVLAKIIPIPGTSYDDD